MHRRRWKHGIGLVLLLVVSISLSGCSEGLNGFLDKVESFVQAIKTIFVSNPDGAAPSSPPAASSTVTAPPSSNHGGDPDQTMISARNPTSPGPTSNITIHDPDAPPDSNPYGKSDSGAGNGGQPGSPTGIGTKPAPPIKGPPIAGTSSSSSKGTTSGTTTQATNDGTSGPTTTSTSGSSTTGSTSSAGTKPSTGTSPDGSAAGSGAQAGSASTGSKSEEQALREEIERTYGITLIDGETGRNIGKSGSNYFASKGTFRLDRLRMIKKVLESLPPHWRRHLQGKSICFFAAIQKMTRNGELDVAGVYWINDQELWISHLPDYYPSGWAGVLYHELTHVLSFDDTSINESWRKIFWGGRSAPPPPPDSPSPTSYGNTDAEEDMAESVLTYKLNPSRLDPVRRKFIERYIFNSR